MNDDDGIEIIGAVHPIGNGKSTQFAFEIINILYFEVNFFNNTDLNCLNSHEQLEVDYEPTRSFLRPRAGLWDS